MQTEILILPQLPVDPTVLLSLLKITFLGMLMVTKGKKEEENEKRKRQEAQKMMMV